MDLQTFGLVALVALVGMFWYSQYSWKGKILCIFRRPNRTVVEKKVPLQSRYVSFKGGKYQINPKRIDLMWYTRGLVHSIFPMFIPFLEFKWDSTQALDPTDFQNTWDSPEARASTREEERFKALGKSFSAQGGIKQTFMSKYGVWIAIGIALIVGYMVYQQSQQLAVLEQLIKVGQ